MRDHRTRLLAIHLSRWFDARLDQMLPPRGSVVQLFGLEVIDRDGIDELDPRAVRVVFLGEGPDLAAVAALPASDTAIDYDAAVTVEYSWAPSSERSMRPGRFAGRQRERSVRLTVRQ
jgi:hypothetical protein